MTDRKQKSSSSPNGKPSPKRLGLSDERVHKELYAAIIDHRISPGTPLLEDALSGAFGVSRTVIRKALQRLSHERLVDLIPNKGASVAKPNADEARQIFDARIALERILVERAISKATDKEFAALAKLAKAEQIAFKKALKQERVRLSGEFHRQLARLGGNAILSNILDELISRTSLIIALYESPGAVPCSHSEHLEIVAAMRRRDVQKSLQYMNHHLQHIEAQIDLTDTVESADFSKIFKQRTAKT